MNNKEKVLYITESPVFGGTDTFLINFANEMKNEDYDIAILVNKDHKGIEYYDKFDCTFFDALPLYELNKRYGILYKLFILFLYPILLLKTTLSILNQIKKINPKKIVIVNGGLPGGLLTYCAIGSCAILKIPTICTIHNYTCYNKKYKMYNSIFEKLFSKANNIIFSSVSNDCASDIIQNSNLQKDINLVYNGVVDNNIEKYTPNYQDDFRICWIGNFSDNKAVDLLVVAFLELNKRYTNIYLDIYGNIQDEEYYNKILSMIKDNKNISLTLNEFDKNKIYKDKHLVVMPSTSFESFGLILVEGLSFGLPIISTNAMGMKEVVNIDENLKVGFTFDLGNSKDLAHKIERFINNKELYENYVNNTKSVYNSYFTISKMVKNYHKLWNDIDV